jgi:hypothetical protein
MAATLGTMGARMRALLEAAERGRPDLLPGDPNGTVQRLRRRPPVA